MELVEGEDLSRRIARPSMVQQAHHRLEQRRETTGAQGVPSGVEGRGPIPLDEALPIARQIADALEAAHDQGIIHRDLKPANIKVREDGTVKVLDFGLAKSMEPAAGSPSTPLRAGGEPGAGLANSPTITSPAIPFDWRSGHPEQGRGVTAAGMILGTAAYMSPEQAKGKFVDKRADIWAFGVVLYEMLTGRRLFDGEDMSDVLVAVLSAPVDLTALPATTPAPIRRLLRRCLERNQKNRLHDIADARIVLDEVLAGTTDDDPAARKPEALGRRSVLRTALPWVAGLALGALISALVALGLDLRRSAPSSMHFRAVTGFAGVQAQPALSPDGRPVAFISNRDGNFNIYVGLVSGGSLVQITDGPNVKATPRWSPEGTLLAYARLNEWGLRDIWQVAALGGTPRRLILNAADPTWSPDGQSLAYADRATGTIWICDAAGQHPRQLTRPPTDGFGSRDGEPRFSPDGRALAFLTRPGGPYGQLKVVDLDSGVVRELTHDQALVQSPAWSPDSLHIYFASSRNGTMNIWKIAARSGEPEQITAGQGDDAQLDVSSDGRRIVFATFREKLSIARLDLAHGTGPQSPARLITDPARHQLDPVYSPDGGHLAYFSNLKGVEREGIWMAGADGANAVQLVQDSRLNIFPRWSPNGEHLIYLSTLSTQTLSIGQYRRVSRSGGAPETILDFVDDDSFDVGADGRMLFRGAQGKLQSLDPDKRQTQTLAVSSLSERGWLPRWSPDGRAFAYIVQPDNEGDPNAGLWVEEFGSPPRQVFRGWVTWYTRGPKDEIVLQEGKADLNGVLWRVGWNHREPERLFVLRLLYSYVNGPSGPRPPDFFDISPDGRHLAFNVQDVLQANIGMIETDSSPRR